MRGDRLKRLRLEHKMSQLQLATVLGVDRTMVGKYELNNHQPSSEILEKMSEIFGVTQSFLMGYDDKNINTKKGVKIPVLEKIAAGIPINTVEEILDYEEIPEEMARNGEYFALKIKGNSMEPRICEGDVVIVRKQGTVENKEVAIVLVNGNEATIKEVQFSQFGITLVGWNIAAYQPHFYPYDEVENLPVQIIGKVVELRGKF